MSMRHASRFMALTTLCMLAVGCGPFSSVTIGKGRTPSRDVYETSRPGPPPHAPAHGHRHKHRDGGRDVELVFDSGLGVYVVLGFPDRYYWDGRYLRIDGDQWFASARLDGGWQPASVSALPAGLRGKGKEGRKTAKQKGKPGGKGKAVPAKGRW